MNILYVSDVDISKITGPGINEREFIQTLQTESKGRGDRACFIVPLPEKPAGLTVENIYTFTCPFKHRALFFLKMIWITCGIFRRFWRLKKDFQPELVVVRISNRTIFVPLILALMKQPYVIKTLEDVFSFNRASMGSLFEKLYWKTVGFFLGKGLRQALFIDACTPQLVDLYKKKYALKNISLVENSVNIDLFRSMDTKECRRKYGLERFDRIAGFCGGKPSVRGAERLVEIAGEMAVRYPASAILIVGEDEGLGSLQRRAAELGLSDRVIFKGSVDYQLVPEYINCIDVGIGFDSTDKFAYVGNASQKIRQYLSCGVPVVCASGTNSNLEMHGLAQTVNQTDSRELFRAVCRFFDMSAGDAEGFSITARNYVEANLSHEVTYRQRYDAWQAALPERREIRP